MRRLFWRVLAPAMVVVAAASIYYGKAGVKAQSLQRFVGATSSGPIAMNGDGTRLAVCNPDNNSVTFFDVENDRNRRLGEVAVGIEPNGVAMSPDGRRAFVANTVSGTVSVIAVNPSGTPFAGRVITNIRVGTEPYGVVFTPNGSKVYVANARSNDISVIDPNSLRVVNTIGRIGFEPRGLAVSNNGNEDDGDETLFVSQFLALPVAVGRLDGEDDSKVGLVTAINAGNDTVQRTIVLRPMADTGFKAVGDAIGRMAPPATPVFPDDAKFVTGAYPNQLNSLAVKGNYVLAPSTGASPNGPVRFDVNTQSLLSVIDINRGLDAGKTINMHKAVADQTGTPKLFLTVPWAIAAKNYADEAFVVSAASNVVVKVSLNSQTGDVKVLSNPSDATRVLEIPVGRNPRGIVISGDDRRAYVMNYISRDVTVIDLTTTPEKVLGTPMRSAAVPETGSPEDVIQIGKELYNTSIGDLDPIQPGGPRITGRMSNNGWGSCSGCHPFGLTDNVVWIFGAGPRRTIPQHTDFDIGDASIMRALNWSALFDEEEDFEANIRGTSGGAGLIVNEDGTQDPALAAFTPASGGRRQLKVRGVPAWDALKAYMQVGIRAPISPVSKDDPDVIEGEQIFRQSNCQMCHGGPQWTSSRIDFTPPPAGNLVVNAQLIGQLKKVGTFDSSIKTEVRANATAPLGPDGFSPASLLSLFAFPQTFFHNGSANDLDQVIANVEHRASGTGVDFLNDADSRRKLIRFLQSIDAATPPVY